MSIKSSLAIRVGKFSQWFLKTFTKGGSSLPGVLAVKIDPNILIQLAKDYEIVIVTGTNGKTLTTALTVSVLKQKYEHVLTNPTGANMQQGIVSTFLSDKKRRDKDKIAVLEVDEASLIHVTKYIKPKYIVFTNVFRDQMDRYGEIYSTYDKMLAGAALAPEATIVCNGDAPIFHSKETVNPICYYGFDDQDDQEMMANFNTDGVVCPNCHHILHYKMITYSNLGKYYCPNCHFKRPALNYALTSLDSVTPHHGNFHIDGEPFAIRIGGLYNVYNALSAYSIGRLFDVSTEQIQAGLNAKQKIFGRQEVVQIEDKEVNILLVKNPVGLNQVIDLLALDKNKFSVVHILNNHYADGIDVSWIWDGNYEKLVSLGVPAMIAAGDRLEDMAFRLRVAGEPDNELEEIESVEELVHTIPQLPTKKVYVLATYTGVLHFRKALQQEGLLDNGEEK